MARQCTRSALPSALTSTVTTVFATAMPRRVRPRRRIVGETLELLRALFAGEWTVADASQRRHRSEASGLVAAYLQWHMERGVRSLRHVERTS